MNSGKTRRVPVQDVFACGVPDAYDMTDASTRDVVRAVLTKLATKKAWDQYDGWQKPSMLEFNSIDWLITKDAEDIEKFQPAHDCAACRAGNDQAATFLRENPNRYVALANISYTEVWSS